MKPVPSPCILVCRLNEHNICVGCGRHLDEIRDWSQLTDKAREQVLDAIRQRQDQWFS